MNRTSTSSIPTKVFHVFEQVHAVKPAWSLDCGFTQEYTTQEEIARRLGANATACLFNDKSSEDMRKDPRAWLLRPTSVSADPDAMQGIEPSSTSFPAKLIDGPETLTISLQSGSLASDVAKDGQGDMIDIPVDTLYTVALRSTTRPFRLDGDDLDDGKWPSRVKKSWPTEIKDIYLHKGEKTAPSRSGRVQNYSSLMDALYQTAGQWLVDLQARPPETSEDDCNVVPTFSLAAISNAANSLLDAIIDVKSSMDHKDLEIQSGARLVPVKARRGKQVQCIVPAWRLLGKNHDGTRSVIATSDRVLDLDASSWHINNRFTRVSLDYKEGTSDDAQAPATVNRTQSSDSDTTDSSDSDTTDNPPGTPIPVEQTMSNRDGPKTLTARVSQVNRVFQVTTVESANDKAKRQFNVTIPVRDWHQGRELSLKKLLGSEEDIQALSRALEKDLVQGFLMELGEEKRKQDSLKRSKSLSFNYSHQRALLEGAQTHWQPDLEASVRESVQSLKGVLESWPGDDDSIEILLATRLIDPAEKSTASWSAYPGWLVKSNTSDHNVSSLDSSIRCAKIKPAPIARTK